MELSGSAKEVEDFKRYEVIKLEQFALTGRISDRT